MKELSLHILDLVQNSIRSGADLIKIKVLNNTINNSLLVGVLDNGSGIEFKNINKVCNPFYTTRDIREVGLGISLFKMSAELTGGSFSINSKKDLGTQVIGVFNLSSVDMLPIGKMNCTIEILIRCNPNLDFIYERGIDDKYFRLDTRRMRELLNDDVALNSPHVMNWVNGYLKEQTKIISGGGVQ